MPAAPPAAPPPRPQGWLQSERIGSAPLRSARFGPVRPGSTRLDSTGPDRSATPGRSHSRRRTGGAGTVPQRTGGGRALPPPCPEPRPLITANYSPGVAAAPPCPNPGTLGHDPGPGTAAALCGHSGTDRGQPAAGSQLHWGLRSHAECRPHAATTARSSSRCKGGAQGRAVGGGLCGARAWEVRPVGAGVPPLA